MSTASNSPRHSARHSARPASGSRHVWAAGAFVLVVLVVVGYLYSR